MADPVKEASLGLPEENLNEEMKLRSSRSGKLSHLTRRMNIVNTLMDDETSLHEVKSNMVMFNTMLEEFRSLHGSYQETLKEEDRNEDTKSWYAPRLEQISTFLSNVTRWINSIENPVHDVTVSYTGLESSADISVGPTEDDRLSLSSNRSVSSTASVRIQAEAERAALLAKAAALQKKHALEDEQEQLRKRMETLNLQAELSATTAKINYLRNAEAQAVDNTTLDVTNNTELNAMNSYLEENVEKISEQIAEHTVRDTRPKDGVHVQFPVLPTTARTPRMPSFTQSFSATRPVHEQSTHTLQNPSSQSFAVPQGGQEPDNLSKILEKQNQLTSLLVKQQLLHTLPKGDLAVFDGNILQYNSFIHSFEHIIESRTDNNQDRLQFLIQYTKGQAQQLVKSCQFMDANRGYRKARQLLKEHFGNAYRISCAYIEKALSWPVIKSEEPRALQDFALFLRSCCNAMEQLQYMEELDTISNMRNIIFILPYKLRERWRSKACEIQQRNIRVRMADLVSFIEKQATIVSDPVFGDIQESGSSKVKSRPPMKPLPKGSFATQVDVKPIQRTSEETMTRDKPRANQNTVPDKACLFCNGKHELMTCSQFDSKPHREKIEFVMQNGVCFGCLAKAGHISKDCAKRLQCTICKKQHPSALHIKAKETKEAKETTLNSMQVSVKADEHTGAGNVQKCTLSIVPVQVKCTKGSKIINTYAFLDPGSSATFCTENLLNKLNIRGKRTNILLKTMNQEQSVIAYMANGIEVSALNENNFIALPEVYTQKTMPVDTDSIPKTEELSRWPYLSEIQIPKIKAEVELLIGNNAPKAIEPWEIINSRENGPYAVKTLLGWVINGPLDDSVMTDSNGRQNVTVNRISVAKLEDLLVQQYNHDFNETLDDKEMSMEDKRFIKCSKWIHGPEFLWKSEDEWPQNPVEAMPLSQDDLEVKRCTAVYSAVIKTQNNPTWQLLEYFSSWNKLKRAVVWYLKLRNLLLALSVNRKMHWKVSPQSQTRSQSKMLDSKRKAGKNEPGSQCISLEDLMRAEKAIIRFCQHQSYPEEMAKLEKTKFVGKGLRRNSTIYKLDPVLEDGVLRVGGRLSKAAMPEEAKRPIILPKHIHVSTLILRHIHEQLGHGGRNHVLSQLRKRFWIVNANSAARKVISKCVVCRCVRGRIGEQKMADLPKERLEADLPPFSNVGVDYFGPFETKRGRSLVKRYGVIFTCMSSRAVHLEMAHSLDTDSCIHALRRFISRRGQVTCIRSDNGTNLVGAKRELQDAISNWNKEKIQNTMLQKGIQWTFNPPAASHHGGVWERLIRMVRQTLNSIAHEQPLDDEGLQTLFCEVESILNSRPISTVHEDDSDLEALTPNHILLLKCHPAFPPGLFQKSDTYIRRRWKQVQFLADLFWKRWTKEYLPLLQERQKWTTVKKGFQVEDIVMVVDSTAPRGSWNLGRIIEVQPDSRGLVRTVKIITKTGVFVRPVTKLCLLLEGAEKMTKVTSQR